MTPVLPLEVEEETARHWSKDGAIWLDVRERSEFEEKHIPGALLIPIGELASRWRELPVAGPVVVYCSAGSRSFRAAKFLREHGLPAAALVGGINEWVAKGGSVDAAALVPQPAN